MSDAKPVKVTLRKKRLKPVAPPDPVYAMLWKLADGAVRDAMNNHKRAYNRRFQKELRIAIVKRITGSFFGFVNESRPPR